MDKCEKNCKDCQYPCFKSGKDLKPISHEELEELGYIICDDWTDKDIE